MNFPSDKSTKILAVFLILFTFSRLFAFGQIYHQDEYKWAMIVNPTFGLGLESEHPPLDAILYKAGGEALGFDHLRAVPIIASAFVLLLAFWICRTQYGIKAAWWAFAILFVSIYEFIASTQIDIDGALLPLAGLLSMFCFLHIDLSNLKTRKNILWAVLFFATVVVGFLIKLSYVLFLGAIATEFLFLLYERHGRKALKIFGYFALGTLGAIALAILAILASKYIFHIQNVGEFLSHAQTFAVFNFSSRNYSELAFLTVKSIVFASPLLLLPYIFAFTKANWQRYRFWLIFIIYNILFYFVIFDFTSRTIERYLMFLIVPSAIIAGSVISSLVDRYNQANFKKYSFAISTFAWSLIGAVIGYLPFFLHYDILPLNPKSVFVDHLKHLNFQFLIPFTGGSGPVGFYMPALYILWSFAIAFVSLLGIVLLRRNSRRDSNSLQIALLGVFLGIGFGYNLAFCAEFAGGIFYGSANSVAKDVVSEVALSSTIKQVITYNDIGGYELNASGKYFKRFYTDPMFADTNVGKFASYNGYYMVVDFPEIDKSSVYWKYLMTCSQDYKVSNKNVSGYIFDCKNGDSNLFKPN